MDLHELAGERIATEGWTVVPGFLDAGLTASLRQECAALFAQGEFHDAAIGSGTGRQVARQVRADQIRWLEDAGESAAQRTCLDAFEQLRLALNRQLQIGLFEFECHFARYAPGAYYHKHVDQFSRDSRRRLSAVLYLNEDWRKDDGGELRLYLGREPDAPGVDILPEGGSLVLFLSEGFPHEVLPARRERLSLTGWFKTRD
jgi:SM-20-related protein